MFFFGGGGGWFILIEWKKKHFVSEKNTNTCKSSLHQSFNLKKYIVYDVNVKYWSVKHYVISCSFDKIIRAHNDNYLFVLIIL